MLDSRSLTPKQSFEDRDYNRMYTPVSSLHRDYDRMYAPVSSL